MAQITDTFGRTITQAADGTWTAGGVAIGPCSADQALTAFDGMAPDGWAPPVAAPQVPATITNFQCRAYLMSAGLFAKVDAAIKAEGGVAEQAWEYSNDVPRNGALVNSMGAGLGLTSAQMDGMFIAAAAIVA